MRTFVTEIASLAVLACLAGFVCVACGSSDAASDGNGGSGASASNGGGAGGDPSGGGGGATSTGSTYSSQVVNGTATFYDATGGGSCMYDPGTGDLDVAAFDLPDFAASASCGTCLDVSGPKGELTIRVVDSCPGCGTHHLDLSAEAFAKIADPEAGRVPITYRAVPCNVQGNVAYRVKEGSSKWWTAIQVRNHRVPVAKLEVRKGGAWVTLGRTDYNYFVSDSGVDDGPIAVRVTAVDGQTLEDTLPGPNEGAVTDGAAQFN